MKPSSFQVIVLGVVMLGALFLGSVLFAVLLSSCTNHDDAAASSMSAASDAASATQALAAGDYVMADDYFQRGDLTAWDELTRRLHQEFDSLCPDTFCEGEFSNYSSLAFRCSVSRTDGSLGKCVWVFGASREEVSSTGTLRVTGRTFSCIVPVAAGTKANDLLDTLAKARAPLETPLPNTTRSIYDGLARCLSSFER